ncbi:MAG: hypothetical protein IM568_04795 [Flavobacterium sp.]|nr:hypothetical protein [Flavobacterium sp.]
MKVVKEKDRFENGQMLIHFGKIYDKIQLDPDYIIIIEFNGNLMEIPSVIVKCVKTYYKLEKKYKLESETLLDEVIIRMGIDYSHITKGDLKVFFCEIYKNIKSLKEKKKLKKKIVWLKKDNNIQY